MKECDMFFPVQCVDGSCPVALARESGELVAGLDEACDDCCYMDDVDCKKCVAYCSDMCDEGTYAKDKEG